jgi:hypothetical protein
MGDPIATPVIRSLAGMSLAETPPDTLSEFERVRARRIAEEGAALAAAVVRWHRDERINHAGDMERQLSHGLGVAALGALIMQILAWVRLMEPADLPPDTLRAARETISTPDPEAEPAALCAQARAMLVWGLDIKDKARRLSRNW